MTRYDIDRLDNRDPASIQRVYDYVLPLLRWYFRPDRGILSHILRSAFPAALAAVLSALSACASDPTAVQAALAPLPQDASPHDASLSDASPADAPGPDTPADGTKDVSADHHAPELPLPPSGLRVGATVVPGGVEFRVWAPHATAAWVSGEVSQTAPFALAPEPDGYFGGTIPGAQAGQRYRFELEHDGETLTRLDPRARAVVGQDAVVVDPTAYAWHTTGYTTPAREDSVVYELHVGGIAGADEPDNKTFAGLATKLDYLHDLGINVIELMPINGYGGHGWGYNPQAYYSPQPAYGAADDLRDLIDQAHARGIAVVLDVVYNHYDGWIQAPLRCFDGDCPGNAGIYFFPDDPYANTPWGPRPNYAEPQVADFIVDSEFAWLTEYRVDGFRWDSTSNIRGLDGQGSVPGGVELLRRVNDTADTVAPHALSIAEDLKGWPELTQSTDQGGLGFDAQWDGFGYSVIEAVVGPDDAARNMNAVRDAIAGSYNGDPFDRLLFTENHDMAGNASARLPQRIDPSDPGSWAARKRSMLAAGILLTTPGIPMLFMGQEFLERGSFVDPPEPLDWSKATSYGPVRDCYRDLIRLRRNLDGVSAGLTGASADLYHVNNSAKVIAYRRTRPGKPGDVIVVANFGTHSYPRYDVGLPADGPWHVRVNTDDKKYSTDFGGSSSADVVPLDEPLDGQPFTGPIVLGGYSVVVLSQ